MIDTKDANRRAAWCWGSLIVGLLGLQVAGGIGAIVLATSDPTVAVVPGYHEKALHWDDQVALRNASAALGWQCELDPTVQDTGAAGLRISLTDPSHTPITFAGGQIELYRHARANDVRRVAIPSGSVGMMELPGCFPVAGVWQVELDVTDRAGNRFVTSQRVEVKSGTASEESR